MTTSRSLITLPASCQTLVPIRSLASRLMPALASLMLIAASGASANGTGRIDVTVTGVSSAPGLVGCALFSSKTGFPIDVKKHATTTLRVPAAGGVAARAACAARTAALGALACLLDSAGGVLEELPPSPKLYNQKGGVA